MDKKDVLNILRGSLLTGIKDKEVRKILFGTYSDGEPRSAIDAYHNEILSPRDRLLIEERMEQIRSGKKKKKKKGKKKRKKKDYIWLDEMDE